MLNIATSASVNASKRFLVMVGRIQPGDGVDGYGFAAERRDWLLDIGANRIRSFDLVH